MRRKLLLSLGVATLLASTVNAYDYQVKPGWQQFGALSQLDDMSIFNDKCVDYLWRYDNTDENNPIWRLHIANDVDYAYSGDTLTSLNRGEGFWLKANSNCTITVNTLDMAPTPPELSGNTSPIEYNGFTYRTIKSPITGKIWLDRNIGATQVCTSHNDTQCYGDYFNITQVQNEQICPTGFKVPSINEINNDLINDSIQDTDPTNSGHLEVKDHLTAFQHFLKSPSAGVVYANGNTNYTHHRGHIWSDSATHGVLRFNTGEAVMDNNHGQNKFSVRCIKSE